MKKLVVLLLVFALMVPFALEISAESVGETPSLSEMTDEEILAFLEEYSIEIPGGNANIGYWMPFIRNTISNVENNGYIEASYNWPATQNLSEAIEGAVQAYYGNEPSTISILSEDSYTLQDSALVSSVWYNQYYYYNCYTYALWRSDTWRLIGFSQGLDEEYYQDNPCPSIGYLKTYVTSDLKDSSLGYNCVKCTSALPTSIPSGALVMCLRSGTYDFHFMRLSGTSWYHKPSGTAPLRYLYSSPSATIWTNERYYNGTAHEPTTTYDSTIYYYVYKTNHGDTVAQYTGEQYHSGTMHYFTYQDVCEDCGHVYRTYSTSVECDGPPCSIYVSAKIPDIAPVAVE